MISLLGFMLNTSTINNFLIKIFSGDCGIVFNHQLFTNVTESVIYMRNNLRFQYYIFSFICYGVFILLSSQ